MGVTPDNRPVPTYSLTTSIRSLPGQVRDSRTHANRARQETMPWSISIELPRAGSTVTLSLQSKPTRRQPIGTASLASATTGDVQRSPPAVDRSVYLWDVVTIF